MTKETLFRAFHPEHGMVEVLMIDFENKKLRIKTKSGTALECYLLEVNLMEYTGIEDTYGVKIFEGDILDIPNDGYVGWCDECANFSLFYPHYGCLADNSGDRFKWEYLTSFYYEEDDDESIVKVIGNIYENPKYLENKFNRNQKHEPI